MSKVSVPRYRSFALGDLNEFERCKFAFLVKHHLQQKYQLEETASPNQVIGSLLDLTVKKIHKVKAYHQPAEFLAGLVKAAEREMRESVERSGPKSFYGSQVAVLTSELVEQAQEVIRNYHKTLDGKLNPGISPNTFWEIDLPGSDGEPIRLWGGADALEMGKDGEPEVVDYKYYPDREKGLSRLDLDLAAKIYVLLASQELKGMGAEKIRFRIRLWNDPLDDSLFEEFELEQLENISNFFRSKAEAILRSDEVNFCEADWCQVCQHQLREQWLSQIQLKAWMKE